MMNEALYQELEEEFSRWRIEEEVEDVLLDLAEILADQGVADQEILHRQNYGKAVIELSGLCTCDEEDPNELNVLIQWIKIGKQKFEINDYLL